MNGKHREINSDINNFSGGISIKNANLWYGDF